MRKSVSAAISKVLYESGLSYAKFAQKVGTTSTSLYRWAQGEVVPNAENLIRVAMASKDPAGFMLSLVGVEKLEWPDPQKIDALEAVMPTAKTVWRSVAQLYAKDPLKAFGKLHSGMAAIYLLAYEAGRVQGIAEGRGE